MNAAAPLQLIALPPGDYLGGDDVIETSHPDVRSVALRLREGSTDDAEFAGAAFEWVRDSIAHSFDVSDPRVTMTASEVLREGVGLCYAKSHLLVAILRAQSVPAGLCYQRLRDGAQGYVLHGLVAVYLNGLWHRQDPRGNKPGIDAQFSLGGERLAYTAAADDGEIDYPDVRVVPSATVIGALRSAGNVLTLCDGGLPADPG